MGVHQKVGGHHDHAQQIVEIVRDVAGEPPDRLHLLLLVDLIFQRTLLRHLQRVNDRCFAIKADLGDPVETEAMVDAVVRRFGRIDILVNNAAIFAQNLFESDDYEDWQRGWQRTFEGNVFGAANAAYLRPRRNG